MIHDGPYENQAYLNELGLDRREFILFWEDKKTGLIGHSDTSATLMPGEAEMWLKDFHRENPQNLYWFEPKDSEWAKQILN